TPSAAPQASTTVSSTTPTSSSAAPAPVTTTTTTATALAIPCDYYAAPDGPGDGRTSSTPFTIQNFWSVATAGKTLCLMDGTYRGDRNMITPPAGLSGTRGRPITLRALNDGAVAIDGQFVRQPIVLTNNNWLELEGFNAKSSVYSVMALHGSFSNNTFRRLVLWDAHMQKNVSVVENDCSGVSTNILFEDVALFGTGRKMVVGGGCVSGDTWTFRRLWTRWEGQTYPSGPSLSTNYDSFGFRCENCISVWSGESMPEAYSQTDASGNVTGTTHSNFQLPFGTGFGLPDTDRQRSLSTFCPNIKVYGSLGIIGASAKVNTDQLPVASVMGALDA